MEGELVIFLSIYVPIAGLIWLGNRNERIKMEKLYRSAVIALHIHNVRPRRRL